MQYTQIASFAYPTDPVYILLVARLRHEGIEHAMADEITINADPLLSQAIGGVKVKVDPADAVRAREIYEAILQEQQEDEGISEEELANLAASFEHPDLVDMRSLKSPHADEEEAYGAELLSGEILGAYARAQQEDEDIYEEEPADWDDGFVHPDDLVDMQSPEYPQADEEDTYGLTTSQSDEVETYNMPSSENPAPWITKQKGCLGMWLFW
jgi:hypothetical protein